jgi:hypothetical protein
MLDDPIVAPDDKSRRDAGIRGIADISTTFVIPAQAGIQKCIFYEENTREIEEELIKYFYKTIWLNRFPPARE